MDKSKYQTRKQKSLDMLKRGVEPVKDGFNEYLVPSQTDVQKIQSSHKERMVLMRMP